MKLLFEDEEKMLVINKGLFGITYHPLFGSIFAISKIHGYKIRVRGWERTFLMIVLNGLRKGGWTPTQILQSYFLDEFTSAVLAGRNSAPWIVCFHQQTPDEVIQRELAET